MKLLLVIDAHLYRSPDGSIWSKSIYDYNFFTRYLMVFEAVTIVSRMGEICNSPSNYLRVDGDNLAFVAVPIMRNTWQYLGNIPTLVKLATRLSREYDCAIFRVPSVLGYFFEHYFEKCKSPFALEVVVDPGLAYPTNLLAQLLFVARLRTIVKRANGVSYVTEHYLQNKYPSRAHSLEQSCEYFTSYYSSISLPDSYYAEPKIYTHESRAYTIIHTANNFNNNNKGHKELIQAIKYVVQHGYDVRLKFIGDGKLRSTLEKMVDELGLHERVIFLGMISSKKKVREILLTGDIFVLPTKVEGLPRAVIEAMSVGLPCISSPVSVYLS